MKNQILPSTSVAGSFFKLPGAQGVLYLEIADGRGWVHGPSPVLASQQ